MSDYHREYADQADARIRELEDKLAGAVEVLNGAGVKMCELIDQLAAYKVAVGKMGRRIVSLSWVDHPGVTDDDRNKAMTERSESSWVVHADPICKAAIDAAKGGE